MKPSTKSPGLEADMKAMFGFDRRDAINANRCVPAPIGCGGPATEFRDGLSEREYTISGLCQACQDRVYKEPEHEREHRAMEARNQARQRTPARYVAQPGEFVTDDYSMFCGSSEAESHRYHRHIGKSGRIWLVADHEAAAENVYVANNAANTTSHYQGFEGFGGRTLSFPLVDGTVCDLHGPWYSNADALYADTGVDARDRHRTFVVLSLEMESTNDNTMRRVYRKIVYRDEAPVLGRYDRYKELIRAHPEAVYMYIASKGGSSSGAISASDRAA